MSARFCRADLFCCSALTFNVENAFCMRTVISILCLFLLFCLSSPALLAQRGPVRKPAPNKPKLFAYPPRVIKLGLSGLFMKSIGAQYEQRLNPRLSFALGATFRPNSELLLYQFMADSAASFGLSRETAESYRGARFGRLTVTPELRRYFRKKTPKGLYLAAFMRYRRDTWKYPYTYQESGINATVNKQGILLLRENALGLGVMLGLQVLTKKKLSLDFWFAGPWGGINVYRVKSALNMNNLNAFDRAIIASKTESLIDADAYPIQFGNSGIQSSGTLGAGGFRMLGIHIGYNF